jgi:aspartate--ammonia ligase
MNLKIPKEYKCYLDVKETEKAIKFIKDFFQVNLAKELNLRRVTAPLFVKSGTGINDTLNGTEKPVCFKIKEDNSEVEIVQSLAKWKRIALAEHDFKHGEGLYTDMNAIRPDEILDNLHSIYVDQWDWERIISKEERNLKFLKNIVKKIYKIIKKTENAVCKKYPEIKPFLPNKIFFIHSEDLEKKYPNISRKEREDEIAKEKKAVFLIGIGANLRDGKPHDGRAPDYDDWHTETKKNKKGLNGDIIVWYPVLEKAFELSSMGIRVDKDSLLKQLEITNNSDRSKLKYHQKLLNNELPLTIGGGIGQSRLCMMYLHKIHIGEVQSSIWSEEMINNCKNNGIKLL